VGEIRGWIPRVRSALQCKDIGVPEPLNNAMGAPEALLRGRRCSVSVSAEASYVSVKLDGNNIRT